MKEMAGLVFGRLTVTSFSHLNKRNLAYWNCVCSCGNQKAISGAHLRGGYSKSCGCVHVENAYKMGKNNIQHGLLSTPIYYTWDSMIARCKRLSHKSFNDYGGRGITVCKEWEKFENFFRDMAPRPKGKTLDRIDNSGNYTKENCRWSTGSEQAKNRRNSIFLKVHDEVKHISDWANDPRCTVNLITLDKRFHSGWSHEDAVLSPLRKRLSGTQRD